MKIIAINMFLIFSIFSINAFSQEQSKRPPKPPTVSARIDTSMNHIEHRMTLSATQKKEVRTILNSFFTEMDDLRQPGNPPDKSKMDALEKERDAKIAKALSEKQYNIYTAHIKEIFPRPPHGPKKDIKN